MTFIEEFEQYVLPTYKRYPLVFVKGRGMKIWDENGDEYLDFFPGWGVGNLGHCHPDVVRAVKEQVENLIHVPNIYYSYPQGQLAKLLSENSFGGQVFFCNSGAEANEGAIKLARRRHMNKTKIITLKNSFHGRTLATLTATGQPKYQEGFSPLPQGFVYCDLNDIDMLKSLFCENTAAIMLEPIQGEGGINIVSKEFMSTARQLCDQYDALLILDEVQTGIGRTGKKFAYEHFNVIPDIMTLAKALGGGLPIGAFVVKKELKDVLCPGTHASTFGGNAVTCAAAVAVLKVIQDESLLDNARKQGQYIMHQLDGLKVTHDIIQDIRGIGLMIGVELKVPGAAIVDACRAHKLLINCTHENVLRLMPALNVTKEEIDQALSILDKCLKAV